MYMQVLSLIFRAVFANMHHKHVELMIVPHLTYILESVCFLTEVGAMLRWNGQLWHVCFDVVFLVELTPPFRLDLRKVVKIS